MQWSAIINLTFNDAGHKSQTIYLRLLDHPLKKPTIK